jgi:hypothetical protein
MWYPILVIAMLAVIVGLLGLLPSTGCDAINWTPLDIGWGGNFVPITSLLAVSGTIIGFEVAVVGYRVGMWVYGLLRP